MESLFKVESLFSLLPTELIVIISYYCDYPTIYELIKLNSRVNTPQTLVSIIYEKYPKYGKDILNILVKNKLDLRILFDGYLINKDIDLEVDIIPANMNNIISLTDLTDNIIDILRIKDKFPHYYQVVIDDNLYYTHQTKKGKTCRFNNLLYEFFKDDKNIHVTYLRTGEIPSDPRDIVGLIMRLDNSKITFDVLNNPNFSIPLIIKSDYKSFLFNSTTDPVARNRFRSFYHSDLSNPKIKAITCLSLITRILKYDMNLFNDYMNKIKKEQPNMLKYFTGKYTRDDLANDLGLNIK